MSTDKGTDKGKDCEVCRCCGAGVVHSQDYNKPTPECIVFLREVIRLMQENIDDLEAKQEETP